MVINPNALGLDLQPGAIRVRPSFWYANEPAQPQTWPQLQRAQQAAGMYPVLLSNGPGRTPAWDRDLAPEAVSDPDDHDAETVLAELWWSVRSDDDAHGEDRYGGWPGLAPARPFETDPDDAAARVAATLLDPALSPHFPEPRAGLVPAARSADIPYALGWTGPCNHAETDVLCAVLRSWEDRFGIRVIGLSFDCLELSVAAPPRTLPDALAIAAEHHAFCPDNVWQGSGSLDAYAKELLDVDRWTFWWD
ncbi:DUF4253 domain-containing protein [Streptomyces sp. MUM 178J]|uniref:DUF4253 domain-containing protein n=1 Tax=Streptomyces sp. MUM 178J TaxID=2791991 RepID=UPI001F03F899|nr:DUF4253 domain-containing protein [Streptomyces sp. MUM 178J]WRQ82054.1 DUF4253 domain-containing protein [Streptomyces sp. MUM 178J]